VDVAPWVRADFDKYPGIWCHGDYLSATPSGGFIVYGRSDATLNPGGVRIGTAEIYRQVEQLDWVVESIAVGQELPDGDTRIVSLTSQRHHALVPKEKMRYVAISGNVDDFALPYCNCPTGAIRCFARRPAAR
jgi:acyl-coenzyme A synthetase/AMP-(fatty) acid ligase